MGRAKKWFNSAFHARKKTAHFPSALWWMAVAINFQSKSSFLLHRHQIWPHLVSSSSSSSVLRAKNVCDAAKFRCALRRCATLPSYLLKASDRYVIKRNNKCSAKCNKFESEQTTYFVAGNFSFLISLVLTFFFLFFLRTQKTSLSSSNEESVNNFRLTRLRRLTLIVHLNVKIYKKRQRR